MQASRRPTYVQVDVATLRDNVQRLRDYTAASRTHYTGSTDSTGSPKSAESPPQLMAVVKANAYGHGLVPTALALEPQVDQFAVALLEEGLALRQAGVRKPILVFGNIAAEQIGAHIAADLSLTAASVDIVQRISTEAAAQHKMAHVHLKIDTGMGRVGVHHSRVAKLFAAGQAAEAAGHCRVVGVYSHFASADVADLGFAREQLRRFLKALEYYPIHGLPMPLRHIANSAGLLALPEAHLDMVRPGIALYGVYPSPETPRTVALQPALAWRSRVGYYKAVAAGEPVSYGSTWVAAEDTRVVTLPVGYADGFMRAQSNRGAVLIRGRRYGVAGRVCMDQTMISLGAHHEKGEAYVGDVVTLLGTDGTQTLNADDVAQSAGTIAYEVLTSISARVPRVYVNA